MISPGRHQKKDVAAALDRARKAGLHVVPDKSGHRWGWVVCCPCSDTIIVSGTPKNSGAEAKRVSNFVSKHRH
ncbi:hypothetical protein NX801_24635 [Streptomyces sp. LP05-1]|uniref:Uncharacterized protein n=1 Tax=Streptomyces pyxinae TaxID=2970734 RepID=A0ABT2CMW8_9ACTN|nr:hypothetical protein [Streptomyces sp. LP05-1]MCS0638785.1 hypothetical protein [Streptomyces sp. LP05-1]